MPSIFEDAFSFIENGEFVNEAVANRVPRQLANNSRYLRDLLETALAGETIIARGRTIESTLEEGQPVWFNPDTLQYEKALGNAEIHATTGALVTSPSSQVAGIVYRKENATRADILVHGVAEVDLSAAVSGTVVPGLLFLSNATPGALTTTRPPIGVTVLSVTQEGVGDRWEVYLNPAFHDFLSAHSHARYSLRAVPAGQTSPPAEGSPHTISPEDNTVEGWLPADNAIFSGNAPEGAKFGYNISASPLAQVWPPVPVQHAVLEMYRKPLGEPTDFRRDFFGLQRVPPEMVVIDRNGIWWMTDCYNEVPWPTTLNTTAEVSLSQSLECPLVLEDVQLVLWYTSVLFATNSTSVLSLSGRDGSGLTFYCAGTNDEKDVGHLEADLDLDLLVGEPTTAGHQVFKGFTKDPDTGANEFDVGPVVESIVSTSPELQVTSSVSLDSQGRAYAHVSLAAVLDVNGAEFAVDTVRLDGVEQEFYEDTLALGFVNGRAAEFRGRIRVPTRVALPSGTTLKIRFWLMGRAAGTVPDDVLTATYRVLSRPTTVLSSKVALPLTDSSLTLDTGIVLDNANEYYEAETAGIAVSAGDEILFTLSRASSDAYAAELHVLRMEGVLVEAP